ncbi:MAG: alpha/beta fold hydrolase [Myxococcota bacterium]
MNTPKPNNQLDRGTILTDDNVEIAWTSIGKGQPIYCCNGVGVSTFFWKYIVRDFQNQFRIVTWDYRGHGSSQRNLSEQQHDLSISRHAQDLKLLMDTLTPGEGSILIGHSMGCQVSLEFQIQFPNQVTGLILLLGTAGRALETFGDNPLSPYFFKVIHRITHRIGSQVNLYTSALIQSRVAWPFTKRFQLVDPLYTVREDFQPYLDHLASMDMLTFTDAILACHEHDAWSHLPGIEVPVLVFAAERDTFTPIHCSKSIAQTLPRGELLILADGSHAALIEQPDTISHRVRRFIQEHDLNGDQPQ